MQSLIQYQSTFQISTASGEEYAVILLDTQGVFDAETTFKDCTSIFSLSILLSSILIFNIKNNIQGDDLSHLELFTGVGHLLCSRKSKDDGPKDLKPFQDLIFLIRDWVFPEENPYGWDGGSQVLME